MTSPAQTMKAEGCLQLGAPMRAGRAGEGLGRKRAHGTVLLAVISALLVVTGTGCKGTINKLKANYQVKQGNDFYKAQDYTTAVEYYKRAARLNPDFPLAYYHAALSYMALYKPGSQHEKDIAYQEGAVENLLKYLKFVPNNEEAKNQLLSVYLQAARYDDAAIFFEAELAKKDKDKESASLLMQKLGMIYAKKGDFEKSLEWYVKRTQLERDNPEALYTVGVLCWDKVYKQGLTLDMERREQLIEMGLDYLNRATRLRKNYFEAISYINLLYREKAKVAQILGNEEEMLRFNEEANKYMRQALDMRKEAMAKQ